MNRLSMLLVSTVISLIVGDPIFAAVTLSQSERGAQVRVDGELFAEYLTLSGHQPAIWPIIGPTGKPMTRSYPAGPLLESEQDDHPHHHSLWFAHENVNGHNFWLEPQADQPPESACVIKHVDFLRMESTGEQAVIVTHNQWLVGNGNVVCEDERTVVFGTDENTRWLDFSIKISATHGPVTFGDAKDGTFAVRVAGTMKVDSGGHIRNSEDQTDAKAWGMPANWVDYYGSIGDQTAGIAIFSHPQNFQHPCRWHVRNYGLFTANPFGNKQFPQADIQQHSVTIAAGEELTLRYRVYLHSGDTKQGRVAEAYEQFVKTPPLSKSLPIVFRDDFDKGMTHWETTDRGQKVPVWSIQSRDDADTKNPYLRVGGTSSYQPPFRSPHSVAMLKDVVVRNFELTAKVQNTNVSAGPHRDLCFFWGYQDPAHFYYVHLGARPDPHSSQIFIVDGADRKMITSNESPGIPWTEGWHRVKVVRENSSGLMQVFFDDMQSPVLVARDKTFKAGRVGLGTFDDHGNFDEFEVRGELAKQSKQQPEGKE